MKEIINTARKRPAIDPRRDGGNIMERGILELTDLAKIHQGFSLGPLSLTLPRGTIMRLVGANGAKKHLITADPCSCPHGAGLLLSDEPTRD